MHLQQPRTLTPGGPRLQSQALLIVPGKYLVGHCCSCSNSTGGIIKRRKSMHKKDMTIIGTHMIFTRAHGWQILQRSGILQCNSGKRPLYTRCDIDPSVSYSTCIILSAMGSDKHPRCGIQLSALQIPLLNSHRRIACASALHPHFGFRTQI